MRIATVAGIPIRLHWSFIGLLGVYLLVSLLTSGWAEVLRISFLAVALFGSVVLHELGHALAAASYGIRTAHITLYPFGGIAAITEMPSVPRQELVIALAGPAVNFVLFAGGLTAWLLFGAWPLAAFAGVNLVMGVFNLIPAFPMDGGRVFRAVMADRIGWLPASRLSMRVGRVFGWLFIAAGLLSGAYSLVLVGGFLLFAIGAEQRRLEWLLARGWRPGPTTTAGSSGYRESATYRPRWRLNRPPVA